MLRRYLFTTFFSLCLIFSGSLAGAAGQDFAIIKDYGLLANAAYEGKAEARRACEAQAYEFSHYGQAHGVEVAYFLGTDHAHKQQVIAVRGTSNVENIMLDADFSLVRDQFTGAMLHSGFAATATAIYRTIRSKLRRDYTIHTTGHSLGGAVALVLAMYLEQDGFKPGKVITFGQPKVTNIAGARRYEHLDITRVVTQKDMIPLVPPFDPMKVWNADIYWHVGEELILLPGEAFSITSGISSMLRAVKFFKEMPGQHNLEHHMMSSYLELIDDKIHASKEVPYKSGFSFSDMF